MAREGLMLKGAHSGVSRMAWTGLFKMTKAAHSVSHSGASLIAWTGLFKMTKAAHSGAHSVSQPLLSYLLRKPSQP